MTVSVDKKALAGATAKAALRYAGMGLKVIAVNKDKTPRTEHGSKDASSDPSRISKWFCNSGANVAITTGKANNLVVIDVDIDDEKGIDGRDIIRTWEDEHRKLPDTLTSITGRGGSHMLYRMTEKYNGYSNAQMKDPNGKSLGVDIRGEGGYFVAPPSIHQNGRFYEWDSGTIAGDDVDLSDITEVDQTVDAFIRYIYAHTGKVIKGSDGKQQRFELPDKIPEGMRTDTLFRLTCSLISKGLTEDTIRAAVKAENAARCDPPVPDKELEKEVFAAFRRNYEPSAPYTKNVRPQDVMSKLDRKPIYDKDGNVVGFKPLQTVRNFETVLENDDRFAGKIRLDEFSHQTYLVGDVPWEKTKNNFRAWSSDDDADTFSLIQSEYKLNNRQDLLDAIRIVSRRNSFHPVRDMLDSFTWDGQEHIRELLPNYLGTEDSEYNYQVMRLWMLGAVARIYQPGCKFDYTLLLQGPQGIGKSTFLQLLAINDQWFCDSLNDLDNDKTPQILTGTWIVEFGELRSLARTSGGVDSVKRFLSAKQDKYRLPYAKRPDTFLRQCVFAGTTNRSDFLTDDTGNRRFLIVNVGVNKPAKSLFVPEVMDDIKAAWAQAVHIWKTEQPQLVLPENHVKQAEELQAECMADDGTRGIVESYVDGKDRVCALQIWREALGEQGQMPKYRASEINSIVLSLQGWQRMKSPAKFGNYGTQRGLQRTYNVAENVDHSGENVDHVGENVDRDTGWISVDQQEIPF